MIFALTACTSSVAIEMFVAGATAAISLLTIATKIGKDGKCGKKSNFTPLKSTP